MRSQRPGRCRSVAGCALGAHEDERHIAPCADRTRRGRRRTAGRHARSSLDSADAESSRTAAPVQSAAASSGRPAGSGDRRRRRPRARRRPRPGHRPRAGHRRAGTGPPPPGRQRDDDRPLARPPREPAAASCARWVATRSGGRWSRPSPATGSRCGPSALPVCRRGESACSSSPAANAASSRIAALPSGFGPRTSSPSGSPARTPSICRPTRCSTSRSGRPAWRRPASPVTPGRS